jgi:hypothetical protein
MSARICRFAAVTFLVLYLASLALLAAGTFGLFGIERDPLSGVYLLPLGLPWVMLLDNLPASVAPWVAIAAPAVNLALIAAVCRVLSRRN